MKSRCGEGYMVNENTPPSNCGGTDLIVILFPRGNERVWGDHLSFYFFFFPNPKTLPRVFLLEVTLARSEASSSTGSTLGGRAMRSGRPLSVLAGLLGPPLPDDDEEPPKTVFATLAKLLADLRDLLPPPKECAVSGIMPELRAPPAEMTSGDSWRSC